MSDILASCLLIHVLVSNLVFCNWMIFLEKISQFVRIERDVGHVETLFFGGRVQGVDLLDGDSTISELSKTIQQIETQCTQPSRDSHLP